MGQIRQIEVHQSIPQHRNMKDMMYYGINVIKTDTKTNPNPEMSFQTPSGAMWYDPDVHTVFTVMDEFAQALGNET